MEQCKLVFPDLVQAISMPANLEFNAPDATKGNGLRTCAAVWGSIPGRPRHSAMGPTT